MMLVLILALRVILGVVFVYAGYRKFAGLRTFAEAVRSFELTPASWTAALAWLVPLCECLGGSALLVLSGTVISAAAALLGGLLLVFSMALTTVWWRRQIVVCNCFGGADGEKSPPTAYLPSMVRNMLLLASAALVALEPSGAEHFLLGAIATSAIYRQGILLALAAGLGWLGVRRVLERSASHHSSFITAGSHGDGQ